MELLLLIAAGGLAWVLWKQSRGEDPTAGGVGRALTGCLGLGCLGVIVVFAIGVAVLWFLLQSLADLDLSLSGLGGGDGGGGGEPGPERQRS